MYIESIMVKGGDVLTTGKDTSLEAAAGMLHEKTTSIMAVCSDDGQIVGVLSERDLVRGIAKQVQKLEKMKVEDLMSPDPVTCSLDTDPIDVLNDMEEGGFRHMPVVENGNVIGLVTKEAIKQFLLVT